MKLKKDPKIENLTIENFIPRGSTIYLQKKKDWLYGLVVYAGMSTKMMQNYIKKDYKSESSI